MSNTPDTPNGDGYAYNFDRRLDRMNDTIASLIEAMLAAQKLSTIQHEQTMDEIRELLNLQKEHRIDIMALFHLAKEEKQRDKA